MIWYPKILMLKAGIQVMDMQLHPQVFAGCNYLSLSLISFSGNSCTWHLYCRQNASSSCNPQYATNMPTKMCEPFNLREYQRHFFRFSIVAPVIQMHLLVMHFTRILFRLRRKHKYHKILKISFLGKYVDYNVRCYYLPPVRDISC